MMLSASGLALHAWWALRWDGMGIRKTSAQAGDELPDTCSVVVCCHNEAPRVAGFHEALRPALNHAAALGVYVQVVAVNHGSTDGTRGMDRGAPISDPAFEKGGLRSRNDFGHRPSCGGHRHRLHPTGA